MALVTLEGVYKDGRIELVERPAEMLEPARVLVTFLPGRAGQDVPLSATEDDPTPEERNSIGFGDGWQY